MGAVYIPPDHEKTEMMIHVSKKTFFNTNWVPKAQPLCAYDMLYHPPDYNPKAARADRQEPQIIRKNIWEQEKHKIITSTTHFMYGRPTMKILDRTDKSHCNVIVPVQSPYLRLSHILEWAKLLNDGKPSLCE